LCSNFIGDAMKIYTHPEYGSIRTIRDDKDDTYFCGIDIASLLKFNDPVLAVKKCCKDTYTVTLPDPKNSEKKIKLTFISEDDVYTLLWKSKATDLDDFERWLNDAVIRVSKEEMPTIIEHLAYNEEYGIIKIQIYNEKLYFCGYDIAKALGYIQPKKAIAELCQNKVHFASPSHISLPKSTYISESDVYRLLAHSPQVNTLKFEKWLFNDVQPKIKKNLSVHFKNEVTPAQEVIMYSQQNAIESLEQQNGRLINFLSILKEENYKLLTLLHHYKIPRPVEESHQPAEKKYDYEDEYEDNYQYDELNFEEEFKQTLEYRQALEYDDDEEEEKISEFERCRREYLKKHGDDFDPLERLREIGEKDSQEALRSGEKIPKEDLDINEELVEQVQRIFRLEDFDEMGNYHYKYKEKEIDPDNVVDDVTYEAILYLLRVGKFDDGTPLTKEDYEKLKKMLNIEDTDELKKYEENIKFSRKKDIKPSRTDKKTTESNQYPVNPTTYSQEQPYQQKQAPFPDEVLSITTQNTLPSQKNLEENIPDSVAKINNLSPPVDQKPSQ